MNKKRNRGEYSKKYYKEKCENEKNIITEKTCSSCNKTKAIAFFGVQKDSKDGHRSCCRECKNNKEKEHYYKNHKEKRIRIKINRNKPEQRQKRKTYNRKYQKYKRDTDLSYRLRQNIGRSIRMMINGAKNRSLKDILPYSIEELKEHLSKKFRDGMSWENYGYFWEIDHIYPQSLLPFSSITHPNFQKCWALENLQPLTIQENRIKQDKVVQ